MPRLRDETFGVGDMTWLAIPPSEVSPRTESLDISAFTANTHYPNGYIPSGTPLAKVGGLMVPYTSAEATTTGAGVLAGHLYSDQPVTGNAATNDFAVPVVDDARVRTAKVPQGTDAFTAPVAAAKKAATKIIYI